MFVRTVLREEIPALVMHDRSKPTVVGTEFVTMKEAARIASVSYSTIRGWVASGRLPIIGDGRTIRVRLSALEAALRGREHQRTSRPADEQAVAILRRVGQAR